MSTPDERRRARANWPIRVTALADDTSALTAIRIMTVDDMPRVAELCVQLGYAVDDFSALTDRFRHIAARDDHAAFVALGEVTLTGWIHVCEVVPLEKEIFVEISGLVVDETCRGQGLGRALMAQGEAWARARDCAKIGLRSQVHRVEAHQFYERLGYARQTTSFFMAKQLV